MIFILYENQFLKFVRLLSNFLISVFCLLHLWKKNQRNCHVTFSHITSRHPKIKLSFCALIVFFQLTCYFCHDLEILTTSLQQNSQQLNSFEYILCLMNFLNNFLITIFLILILKNAKEKLVENQSVNFIEWKITFKMRQIPLKTAV